MKTKDKYDVTIIGAGIGGLVCGCYLAKAGLKVLIIEKHHKAGGYCASFKREGFSFDVAVHYIGAARYGGEINRIMEQLDLKKRLKFLQMDPCDKIILPKHIIFVRKNYNDTVEEFKSRFPSSKENFKNFFNLILNENFLQLYSKLKKATFEDLLNEFFDDFMAKGAIGTLLGNIGLPPSRVSALTAVFLYREFILDPGYYPEGGIQVFPDVLATRFKELGGEMMLSKKVTKIIVKNNKAVGVEVVGRHRIESDYTVSNIDASQTFLNLIDKPDILMCKKIEDMELSISAFAIYVALDVSIDKKLKDKCAIWNFFTYDMEKCYGNPENNIISKSLDYFVCTFPSIHDRSLAPIGKSSMGIFILAPYKNKNFWDLNRSFLTNKLISAVNKLLPGIKNKINLMIAATPHSFYRYTFNKNGAIYGWASTPKQINMDLFPQKTYINKLFMAGHWCTNGLGQGGVSEVAYTGRRAAKLIIKDKAKNGLTPTI